jgi:hypothetical protein
VAWIFSHRPKIQKHVRACNVTFAIANSRVECGVLPARRSDNALKRNAEIGLFTKPSLRMTFHGFINFLNLSFPENEDAVKGNFPAGVFMPVRGVMRTSWVWEPVIFFAGL